ncbi:MULTISPECIES: single-stranded DNA-binding protein [Rhodomicrobium]|uniref:single-stranded DNA-binding protein n=1 Tax=Rhodomicrobium TaxID=1068 RepID=UPI001482120A|nr:MULTISPECIES: single-stranded DNA-binding protein [Rhodomicrobium]
MLNKVLLIGHLGQAPQLKQTSGGQPFAILSLATTERWRDKAGNRHERTEWHRIVVWRENLLEFVERLKKGSKVWVEGSLASRRWEDEKGIERYTTEIVLQGFNARLERLDRSKGGVPDPEGEDAYGTEREPADA